MDEVRQKMEELTKHKKLSIEILDEKIKEQKIKHQNLDQLEALLTDLLLHMCVTKREIERQLMGKPPAITMSSLQASISAHKRTLVLANSIMDNIG